MKEVCADLLAEYTALADLADTLTPQQWAEPTRFYGWSPWDEIAHLHFFDGTGLLAATDPQAPCIELRAHDGQTWTWNQPSNSEWLRGSAEDFCLVVTQRRHPSDTGLEFAGEGTRAWMSIAQCFAGPPADGLAPGVREVVY